MKTHSILVEDMSTGYMCVMEFYTLQAALNAIEGVCEDQGKTVHGPFVLGAAEADLNADIDAPEDWFINKEGKLVRLCEE